jgi:hypothetical protein
LLKVGIALVVTAAAATVACGGVALMVALLVGKGANDGDILVMGCSVGMGQGRGAAFWVGAAAVVMVGALAGQRARRDETACSRAI